MKFLEPIYPVRYTVFLLCWCGLLMASLSWWSNHSPVGWVILFGFLVGVGLRDLRQPQHAILRNYPVIGHLRFLLEFIRPEIRQYFIEGENEAAPFSRAQRSVVYQRAKDVSDSRPFGTQLDVGIGGYEWMNHSVQPTQLASQEQNLDPMGVVMVDYMGSFAGLPHRVGSDAGSLNVLWGDMHVKASNSKAAFSNPTLWTPDPAQNPANWVAILNLLQP